MSPAGQRAVGAQASGAFDPSSCQWRRPAVAVRSSSTVMNTLGPTRRSRRSRHCARCCRSRMPRPPSPPRVGTKKPAVGAVIAKSVIPGEEQFITTKLWVQEPARTEHDACVRGLPDKPGHGQSGAVPDPQALRVLLRAVSCDGADQPAPAPHRRLLHSKSTAIPPEASVRRGSRSMLNGAGHEQSASRHLQRRSSEMGSGDQGPRRRLIAATHRDSLAVFAPARRGSAVPYYPRGTPMNKKLRAVAGDRRGVRADAVGLRIRRRRRRAVAARARRRASPSSSPD